MRQIILFFALLLPVCAFPQLKESFGGPLVNTAHSWQGDLDKFKISNDGFLQLDSRPMRDKAFLYLEGSRFYENEWSFRIRSDYKGTTSNYMNVYVWSRQPDLANPGLAYLVRIGYSDNNIAFCIQEGNQKPRILQQTQPSLGESCRLDIKVVLDKAGRLALYTKSWEESLYKEEFSVQVETCREAGYFMLAFYYSSTHHTDKFFDDLFIAQTAFAGDHPDEPQPDPTPLRLCGLEETNEKELVVTFTKEVVPDLVFFRLTELGEADEEYCSDENTSFKLVWEQPRKKGKPYTLVYSGIYDEEGNECEGDTTFISRSGASGQTGIYPIRINEILADPKGVKSLPETEYVELSNLSATPRSLHECVFIYDKTTVPLGSVSIPANGYAVLYKEGRSVSVDETGIAVPIAKFPAQLANAGGKCLQLKSPDGTLIDSITYTKAKPGISWERTEEGWALSTDPRGGTPGSENSVKTDSPDSPDLPDIPLPPHVPDPVQVLPGEFVFNELLPNPLEGGSEYIELYNRSDRSLPLAGLGFALRKTDGTLRTRYPLTEIQESILPGGYAAFTKNKTGVSSFYLLSDPNALFEILKLPILANTSSTLVLYREADGVVIDEITYFSKWHASSVKDEKGVALERIDPDRPTQDPSNWTSAAATSGYGTPGYRNSQYGTSSPGDATGIEAPVWQPDSEEYLIRYLLDQPGYGCRIFIYDTSGRCVAEICNHELLGTEGEIRWKGCSSGGSLLKTGVYIFYAELYHAGNGKARKYKKAFLMQ